MSDDTLKRAIIDALKTVYDPEIPVNIYDLGLIYDIIIDEQNNVKIHMTLTAPGCPVAGTFPQMVSDAVTTHVSEVQEVTVELVWDPPWSMDRMSEVARLQLGIFD
jgi:FeS assembly SUF system protein